jgi:hypothetical protein
LLTEHLHFVVALSISFVFLVLWLFLWKIPQWRVADVLNVKDRIDLELKARQTMAQILGGFALLFGLYFTAQTLRTTQESQITDRFTKAITQLGDNNLAIRLGGIYALERIAKDSASDHWSVMEVLTAFVREHPHEKSNTLDRLTENRAETNPSADIQAVLTVVGRRTRTWRNGESQRLDLAGSQLQGANLSRARLEGANLSRAQMEGANLSRARLEGAKLHRAQMEGANLSAAHLERAVLVDAQLKGAKLHRAQMEGANLSAAHLERANLSAAHLERAVLVDAWLEGANLTGANLTGAYYLTQHQVNVTCVNEDTKLPEGLTKPAPCPHVSPTPLLPLLAE